jgi:hypothetical protein
MKNEMDIVAIMQIGGFYLQQIRGVMKWKLMVV